MRQAIADRYNADLGIRYDPEGEVLVTCGAGEAMLDVLLSYVDAGDKVLMTNPTYNGMAQRVRLASGVGDILRGIVYPILKRIRIDSVGIFWA